MSSSPPPPKLLGSFYIPVVLSLDWSLIEIMLQFMLPKSHCQSPTANNHQVFTGVFLTPPEISRVDRRRWYSGASWCLPAGLKCILVFRWDISVYFRVHSSGVLQHTDKLSSAQHWSTQSIDQLLWVLYPDTDLVIEECMHICFCYPEQKFRQRQHGKKEDIDAGSYNLTQLHTIHLII